MYDSINQSAKAILYIIIITLSGKCLTVKFKVQVKSSDSPSQTTLDGSLRPWTYINEV